MIKVGKAIQGVSINGKEWLLNEKNELIIFASVDEAKEFLIKNGFKNLTEEELEDAFLYEEVEIIL